MTVYLVNIALLIFWAVLLLRKEPSKKQRLAFTGIASLQWIILSSLRHISIGADTAQYSYNYSTVMQTSWSTLLRNFSNILFSGQEGKDPGYYLFVKFTQVFTTNYQVYLIIIAVLFTVPLGIFIYRNSRGPLMSFIIYSTLFYAFYAITGHRQTIATALVVFIGYEFIKKRRFLPFLLLTLIALTIHKSSILFFPFYFIANKEVTNRYLVTMAVITALILVLGKALYAPIAELLRYESYIHNEIGGTGTFTFLMFILGLVAFWRKDIILQNNPQALPFFNAMIIAVLLSLMTLENQSFMRVQQYYSLFIMLLAPEIVRSFKGRERAFAYFTAVAVLLFLFIRNNPHYLFFWQGM